MVGQVLLWPVRAYGDPRKIGRRRFAAIGSSRAHRAHCFIHGSSYTRIEYKLSFEFTPVNFGDLGISNEDTGFSFSRVVDDKQIFVSTVFGTTMTMDMGPMSGVNCVRSLIVSKLGIPSEGFYVAYASKVLSHCTVAGVHLVCLLFEDAGLARVVAHALASAEFHIDGNTVLSGS